MALTNWNDILNKPNGIDEVPEIALTVEQLSASVLSISEDVGEIAGDVQEIALEVSQLSASTLTYSGTKTIKQKIENIELKKKTFSVTPEPNSYASPFTHAAAINYDNDIIDAGHFVCGNAVVGAAVVIIAAPTYMLVYCNNSSTFNVDIYYIS